jgi:maleylpyruvate isomerase
MILHGYFRSSAAWRVRIALGLKGLAFTQVAHHLRRGEQCAPDYLALNPQGLVPTLVLDDGTRLTQSLAIISYLDEAYPEPPLVPADRLTRARARAFTLVIVADTHPVQNLLVLQAVRALAPGEHAASRWAAEVNVRGLTACEALLEGRDDRFCFGPTPGMADIVLVPQLANARRFRVDLTPFPRLLRVEQACMDVPAFQDAVPERQPDAE